MKYGRNRCNMVALLLVFLNMSLFAQINLLQNAGFENWSSPTELSNWQKESSTTLDRESGLVYQGIYAAKVTKTSSSANRGIVQEVSVTPGVSFTFKVWVYNSTSSVGSMLILRWKDTDRTDIGGKQSSKNTIMGSWQQLIIENAVAPENASFADCKIRVYDAIDEPVYVDDAFFYDEASLSVRMSGFYATVEKDAVQIRWQTASEVDTRGFHVSRGLDKDGPFERLTTMPIPAKGNDAFGEAYSYTDYTAEANAEYWYYLEELDVFGQVHSLGKLRVLTSENGFLPADHELIGSYPNPFNPQTTIEYRIGETGEEGGVDLSIYNLIGQKVKTLAAGQVTPGHHVEQWFGDDETGNPVSSGMYVLRLSVDGMLVESGKLIKME